MVTFEHQLFLDYILDKQRNEEKKYILKKFRNVIINKKKS